MLGLILVSVLAAASAAPHFPHHHHHHQYMPFTSMEIGDPFTDDYFDTSRFWRRFGSDMEEMGNMMRNFQAHFKLVQASAGYEGNQYKVKLSLPGFEEKDIVVKAREGSLMVQAIHTYDDASTRNYVDIRTLPPGIDVTGIWVYDKDILTITFPLKTPSTAATTVEETTPVHVTQAPASSAEGINLRSSLDEDADVGLNKVEIRTNDIPKQTVEATTYAVDLKDQYEFVPVHYRK